MLKKDRIRFTAAQAAVFMFLFTFISKCLGFLRELVLADIYGTSYVVDAYVMANSIPTMLLGGVFAAISTAYMPSFSEISEKLGQQKAQTFTNQIITLSISVAFVAAILGTVFSQQLTAFFAGKFPAEPAALTAKYLKTTIWIMAPLGATGILSAFLQYHNHFLLPILAGLFFDICIIIGIVVSSYTTHYYLAYSLLAGYLCQLLFTFIFAWSKGYRYRFSFAFNEPLRKIISLSIPVFIGTSIIYINSFVDKYLASGLPEGAVSALHYGYLLISTLITMSSLLIATVLYPKLTKAFTNENWGYFNVIGKKCIIVSLIFSIPVCLGALVFSEEFVQIIYERGAFGIASTQLTHEAFFFYALGFIFLSLNHILVQIYYSMRDTKTPMICSGIGIAANIILNIAFIDALQHKGLALATSIAMLITVSLQVILIKKRHHGVDLLPELRIVLRIAAAALPAVAAAYAAYQLAALIWMPRTCYLLIAVICAIAVYLPLLKILHIHEVSVIIKEIIKKK